MSEREIGDEGAISLAEVLKENTSSGINEDEDEDSSSDEDSSEINEDYIDEDDWPATLGKCLVR